MRSSPSMPTSVSMSQEHEGLGLTPASITIVDDTRTTTTTTEDYYNYTHVAKQPHYFPRYSTDPATINYYYPSSPETRISMSGSSSGSYSILPQRTGNWDSAVAMSPSSPISLSPAVALNTHAEASRAEAGFITDNYKNSLNHSGLSWSAEGSLSDGGHGHGRNSSRSVGGVPEGPSTVTVYTTTADDKEAERNQEPNAVLVLLLLSAPIPFFSICTSIYALLAVFLVIFTSPLRLCPPTAFFRSTFSTQLCKLLAPALCKHDRLAQSSTSHYNHHRLPTITNPTDTFSAPGLILVLTLAPFLCFGLLLAVWIAAFFWIFAMILGNPDGTERKDDGRAAVLGVNRWWQTWLTKGRKAR
uniref:Acylphosphatase n=1 Tax=Talaromyces marneffei PM1 TaxID=1077442 RepID=A0A093USY4_TALMA